MKVTVTKGERAVVFGMDGRLDSNSSSMLESKFLQAVEQGELRFIFDFSSLQYISSSGLRIMLVAAKKCKTIGGKLALCSMSANVHEVFQMSGFTSIFTICPDLQEAEWALQ